MTTAPESYDVEAVHDAQIAPLMAQVVTLCQEHGIPMVASFALAVDVDLDPNDFLCCTSAVLEDPARTPPIFRRALAILYQGGDV